MPRLGKIARLPRAVRDTLNVRLQEGDSGPDLLTWLNAAPGVQAVLAEHFDGQPVNAQNLSEWRRGGHAAWCQQQQIFELAERLQENQADLAQALGEAELGECLAQASLLVVLRELQATWRMEEGPERLRAVLAIMRASDRVQRTRVETERARREQAGEEHTGHRAERPVRLPERTAAVPVVRPAAAPVRSTPPPLSMERETVSPDDDKKISAVWASAMKLATAKPGKPGGAAMPYLPYLPKLTALQAA